MAIGSHTIPRFYLEQFANASGVDDKPGKLWVYQKSKKPALRSTRAQGYENGYFGYRLSDGRLDESLETQMAKLEAECDSILVSAKSPLCDLTSLIAKNRLAFYVALLFQRSTSKRKFSSGNWLKIKDPYKKLASNEEYLQDLAAHWNEKSDEAISVEQIREMILKQAERCTDKTNINNSFVSEVLGTVDVMKKEFAEKQWQVWGAPDGTEFDFR